MAAKIRNTGIIDWALRLVPAAILLMAVPGKFTADPAAVGLFTALDAEPFGRLATAGFESLAVLLLLLPPTVIFGALLAAGLMTGAIVAHIAVLGVAPGGDPSMFLMALVAFSSAMALAWRRKLEIPLVSQFVRSGQAPVA